MNHVLITGGTGLVGSKLTKKLAEKQFSVSYLSRSPSSNRPGVQVYEWKQKAPIVEEKTFKDAQYIVHLAGANIGDKRWSESQKKILVESRLDSSEFLFTKLKEHGKNIKAVISASAIGIYGDHGAEWVDETTENGKGFLPELCKRWESSVLKIQELGIRTVILRFGVVLSGRGGALPKMVKPIKYWAGAPIGNGEQYISWIHIDDLCNIIIKAMEDTTMSGIYNAVAPSPVTNFEFTRMLANFMEKPLYLPKIPKIIFKLMFGEMSQILLDSIRVKPERLLQSGYTFIHPKLDTALIRILKKHKGKI